MRNKLSNNRKFQRGFTLIELLVAIVVIGSFGSIVVNIITSAFRGTSKTGVINTVRENGNYAISEITRKVKYAKSFNGASTDGSDPWTCQVVAAVPSPTPAQYKAVKTIAFDGTVTTFSCNDSADTPPETIVSNSESLIDTTSVALPAPIPTFCFFTCQKASIADSPQVGINFTLTSKITSGIAEKQSTIPFNTSIKVRN